MQQSPIQAPALAAVTELALLIGGLDGVPDRLIRAHVAAPDGYCRGCLLPQSGPMRWPCTLRVVAEQAGALQRTRRLLRP